MYFRPPSQTCFPCYVTSINEFLYLNHLDDQAKGEGKCDDYQEQREDGEDGATDTVAVPLVAVLGAASSRHDGVEISSSAASSFNLDEGDSDLRLETTLLLGQICLLPQ